MFLRPDFPALSPICVFAGILIAPIALAGVIRPGAVSGAWKKFPRSVWPGRVMTAVALAWTALWAPSFIVEFAPSMAERLLPLLQYVLAGMILATCYALPELLSCRAAGLLMLLVPSPLLSASKWHPSPCRLFVVAISYLVAVCGMFVVARPWLLRDAVFFCNDTPQRTRFFSGVFLLLALALLAIGFFAFPVSPETAPLR